MHDPAWIPIRFIDEEITVEFDRPPALKKKPGPPSRFEWQGRTYEIGKVLSEWFDHARRGRMSKNIKPQKLPTASRRGTWGVGRFYFRLESAEGLVFDLYYDRAPEEAGDRSGHWFLWRELGPREGRQGANEKP